MREDVQGSTSNASLSRPLPSSSARSRWKAHPSEVFRQDSQRCSARRLLSEPVETQSRRERPDRILSTYRTTAGMKQPNRTLTQQFFGPMNFEIDEDSNKKEKYDEQHRSSEILERVHDSSDCGVG